LLKTATALPGFFPRTIPAHDGTGRHPQAAARLQGQVLDTPCVESRTLSQIVGAQVFLKFENLQFTASFKERGACNKLTQLTAEERAHGVVAMSAGNHAQGVAYHAQRLGLRAVIVMPRFTPGVKVERTRGFGAEVVLHGDTLDEARAHAWRWPSAGPDLCAPLRRRGRVAGQGTVGLEMLQAVPDLDTLVIAVGGGGLIAGMATAAKALKPGHRDRGRADARFPAMVNAIKGTHHPQGTSPLPRALPWARRARSRRPWCKRWWTTWCWWTRATSSRPC
jgi:threonine dehydratase